MTAYAERYFYLSAADGGESRQAGLERKLERAERKGNARRIAELSAELATPPCPQALAYLWRTYIRLRRRTDMGFAGPQPIRWRDIDAFVNLTGVSLVPWEVELIERLDDTYLQPDQPPTLPEGQSVRLAASTSDSKGIRAVLGSVGNRRYKRKGG